MQVELYADYEPGQLMTFLVSSQAYGLEAAAELCEHRGLVREQVFVLGRMGNARRTIKALEVIQADETRNLLVVKGSIPGPNGGLVMIRKQAER